jgi:hypothetical protein
MNGHWDVTETKEFLEGIRTGPESALKKVYRQYPKYFERQTRCASESYEMQLYYKAHEDVREYYNPMFCFLGDHVYFEIPVYDDNGNNGRF